MRVAAAVTHDELIASFTGQINQTLNHLIPAGTSCALLDFPNHPNVGDSALWLGERFYLRRIQARVAYVCDRLGLDESRLARRLGANGIILLHGGGNLGDLWPAHQRFRERVIAAFPHHCIVQFPQTIHFREHANLAQARRVFNAHPNITLLVRDHLSLEIAKNEFRATSMVCPDMALALGALTRPHAPTRDITWLVRHDTPPQEQERLEFANAGLRPIDWFQPTRNVRPSLSALHSLRARGQAYVTRIASSGAIHAVPDMLAARRLRIGCRLLSQGRIVVTNRLHGHLLSLLLRIPHVIVDNGYGKITSYYETWTKSSGITRQANSWREALAIARAFADEHWPPGQSGPGRRFEAPVERYG